MNANELFRSYAKIIDQLEKINSKLDELLAIHKNPNLKIDHNIIALPKHLQTTLIALQSIGKGSATDIAEITGKQRALESHYLNQLVNLGRVYKKRQSRKVVFELRSYV